MLTWLKSDEDPLDPPTLEYFYGRILGVAHILVKHEVFDRYPPENSHFLEHID